MRKWFVALLFLLATAASEAANISYRYDAAGRLIEADYGDKKIVYEYDNNGNLVRRSIESTGSLQRRTTPQKQAPSSAATQTLSER